jgi:hypothetical protein
MMDGLSGWHLIVLLAMVGGGVGLLWGVSKRLETLIKEIKALRYQFEASPYRTQDTTLYGLSQRTAEAVEQLVEQGKGPPPSEAEMEAIMERFRSWAARSDGT